MQGYEATAGYRTSKAWYIVCYESSQSHDQLDDAHIGIGPIGYIGWV